jgi:hypothetical protein
MMWCHLGGVETEHRDVDHPFVKMNTIFLDVPLLEEDVFLDVRMLQRVCGNTSALASDIQAIA